MPAQIIVDDEVLGSQTFALHSVAEIGDLVDERAQDGLQTVVFAFRKATSTYVAAALQQRPLRVGTATGATSADERTQLVKQFQAHQLDVIVATDAMAIGWRAPAGTAVLHAEIPPYGAQFRATMLQREARALSGDATGLTPTDVAMGSRTVNPCPDMYAPGHRNCAVCNAAAAARTKARRRANPCPEKYAQGHRNCAVCDAHMG